MHRKATFALLSAAAIGQVAAGEAPETSGNPPNVVYKATVDKAWFPDAVLPGPLKASISAKAPSDGEGVKFNVHFDNLPEEGGPFTYHLHRKAVPADGNCTEASSHLDPYGAGAEIKCDKSAPETCEVGDLSGKYGAIESSPYHASYHDLYAATKEGDEAFFGDLSFVLHYANSTRLACANFVKQEVAPNPTDCHPPNSPVPTGTPTPTGPPGSDPTGPPDSDPTAPVPPPSDGAAQMSILSIPAMLLGAAAVAFGL